MKCRFVLMLILSLPGGSQDKAVNAAKDTIWIGSDLQLGVSKEAMISQLGGNYQLLKIAEGDEWIVESKIMPLEQYGQVSFTNGKLTYASKDWTHGEEDKIAFVQALQGAMDQFVREDKRVCYVDAHNSRSPGSEMRSITLYCGAKKLIIQTTEFFSGQYKGRYAQINEILSSEKYR